MFAKEEVLPVVLLLLSEQGTAAAATKLPWSVPALVLADVLIWGHPSRMTC